MALSRIVEIIDNSISFTEDVLRKAVQNRRSPATVIGDDSRLFKQPLFLNQKRNGKAPAFRFEPSARTLRHPSSSVISLRGKVEVTMKRPQFIPASVFVLFFAFMVCGSLFASGGRLSGFILDDQTGLPIPDANIILQNTPYGAVSRDGGYFSIDHLPHGQYTVIVRVMGYRIEEKKGITIADSENSQLTVRLTPAVISMNPLIVTAAKSEHLAYHTPSSSEVYTAYQMKMMNGMTAGEAVSSAEGVVVRDNGGFAGLKTLSIRGSNDSQVLILLDGQRLNTSYMGGVDINGIPLQSLERIEIVRGGHSALLGSDAIGGAVQLVTRESIPPRGYSYSLQSMMGSWGTYGMTFLGSHAAGPLGVFLTYNHMQSAGNYPYTLPGSGERCRRDNNRYSGDGIFLKLKLDPHSSIAFKTIHQLLISKRGVPGSVDWPSSMAHRDEIRFLNSLQAAFQITDRLRLKGQATFQAYSQHYSDPGSWIPEDSRHNSRMAGLDLHSLWFIHPSVMLVGGAEFSSDALESSNIGKHGRKTASAYVHCEITHGHLSTFAWEWLAGIRWDAYSRISSQFCPKLGFLVYTGENFRLGLKGNAGRSFRAPSFSDLYWPEDAFARGNPDLRPEVGMDYDLGLFVERHHSGFLRYESNFFYRMIRDLILWQSGPDWIWTPQNIGRARIDGLENSFTLHLPGEFSRLRIAHTWMRAINRSENDPNSGKSLIYRPKFKIDVLTGFDFVPFHLEAGYQVVGERFTSEDNTSSLPMYHLFNANVMFEKTLRGLILTAKLEGWNLADHSIMALDGYPLPGREIRFSLGFQY